MLSELSGLTGNVALVSGGSKGLEYSMTQGLTFTGLFTTPLTDRLALGYRVAGLFQQHGWYGNDEGIPEDIVSPVLLMVSGTSNYIAGSTLVVDGSWKTRQFDLKWCTGRNRHERTCIGWNRCNQSGHSKTAAHKKKHGYCI